MDNQKTYWTKIYMIPNIGSIVNKIEVCLYDHLMSTTIFTLIINKTFV
jgi:hypothetical protein